MILCNTHTYTYTHIHVRESEYKFQSIFDNKQIIARIWQNKAHFGY